MSICVFNVRIWRKKLRGTVIGLLFLGLSIAVYITDVQSLVVSFVLGLMACTAVIFLMVAYERKSGKAIRFLVKYTMPISLMHTLFATPMSSILLKVGITNAVIQVVLGLGISFVGLIVAAWIMKIQSGWSSFCIQINL